METGSNATLNDLVNLFDSSFQTIILMKYNQPQE